MIVGDHLFDDGNIALPEDKDGQIKAMIDKFYTVMDSKQIPICLGGDHLVKYAGIAAAAQKFGDDVYVFYLDAHPDCHMVDDLYYGSILHHIFQKTAVTPDKTILVGLRQSNAEEKEGFDHYKIPTIWGADFSNITLAEIYDCICQTIPKNSKVYISIDLDGLDPSDTPGVEQPYPGGPKINQAIALIHRLGKSHDLIGLDITEFLPSIDSQKLTALGMARLAKEFAATVK